MELAESLQYIKQENPELLADMQALISACPTERDRLNRIFLAIGLIKGQCVDKRHAAQTLIGQRTCTVSDATTSLQTHSQFLRQPPDVMIRTLCRIAELTHHFAGDPAFLDALEARNNG